MKTSARLASVGGMALTATALAAAPSLAAVPGPSPHRSAVFVQTDGTAGNAVVAYDRAADGTLTRAGTYPTGGVGGVLTGSVVDHVASQGSVTLDRAAGLLYVVNAGSNTVTVFGVDGDRLQRLQALSSGGTFPVSVTTHGDLVYVLNARAGGAIQGYLRIGRTLVRIPAWNRPLGLDPTATPEFTHTPGQIAFTPDGSQLVVTTKGNTSSIDVFGVGFFGRLAAQPVVNALPGAVPFAVTFDAGNHLVVAEAGTNAVATFSLSHSGNLTPIAVSPTGQAATCWIVRSGDKLYASNAGGATLSGYTDPGNGSLTSLGNTGTDAGTVDATVSPDGRFLYAGTGAAGVVDEFSIGATGGLTRIGSVTVPGAVGGEGIAAS